MMDDISGAGLWLPCGMFMFSVMFMFLVSMC